MTDPIIRFWDVENTENVFKGWRCGKQYVGPTQILQERKLICGSWKDLGDDIVYHTPLCSFGRDNYPLPPVCNDEEVVASLLEYLADADILVAHNGDYHDLGILNARALYYGFDPLPPIPQIDTYKIARKHFNLNSNKLDYLAQYLGVGKKIKTDYELWDRCLFGDRKALNEMLEYNIEDVRLLEKVYLKLRPFITSHPNLGVLAGTLNTCPNCGAVDTLSKNGTRLVGRVSVRQRYHCSACGAWPAGPAVRIKDVGGINIDIR